MECDLVCGLEKNYGWCDKGQITMKSIVIVCNWKMNKTVTESIDFCTTYGKNMDALMRSSPHTLVLCPSAISMLSVAFFLEDMLHIKLGSQDVSAVARGSYTGQTDAASIAQAGATYGIVGHVEARAWYPHTVHILEQKLIRLREHAIVPILCVSETYETSSSVYSVEDAYRSLIQQLEPLLPELRNHTACIIAYEPAAFIGTGNVPPIPYLEALLGRLHDWLAHTLPGNYQIAYGGGVTSSSVYDIVRIDAISGLLVGSYTLTYDNVNELLQAISAD